MSYQNSASMSLLVYALGYDQHLMVLSAIDQDDKSADEQVLVIVSSAQFSIWQANLHEEDNVGF